MSMKYRIYNILWDTDGDEEVFKILPSEVILWTENLDIDEDADEDEIEEAVLSYLSDEYGFCHFGFSMEVS